MNNPPQKRKPGRPKGKASEQTMQQILRTAALLFMEQGFEKVSLEGVAKACGITKASVYYYFNNKAVLFTECLLFILRIAYIQTEKIAKGEGTLQERLNNIAERHMSNANVEFETMMREASSSLTDEQINKIRLNEHAIHELMASVFQEAMDSGDIIQTDPLLIAHVFTAMLTVKNRKEIINVHKSVRKVSEEIVELLMTGIKPSMS